VSPARGDARVPGSEAPGVGREAGVEAGRTNWPVRSMKRNLQRRHVFPPSGGPRESRARLEVEATLVAVEESELALRLASEPHVRGLCQQRAALAEEVRQLEARQQARVAFIGANSGVLGRIAGLARAVETERSAERRRQVAATGAPRRHDPRRLAEVAHEPPPAPSRTPSGPDL
jgi:hypothetical protein